MIRLPALEEYEDQDGNRLLLELDDLADRMALTVDDGHRERRYTSSPDVALRQLVATRAGLLRNGWREIRL